MVIFDEGAFDTEEDEEEVFDDDEFLVLDPRSSAPVWEKKGVVFRATKFQDFFQLFFLLLWLIFGAGFLVVIVIVG